MGCNCGNTIRKDKAHIRTMAIKYAVFFKEDVQIHSWTERGIGRLYDFEPAGSVDRGSGVIEIIKFRDHQSKDVLSDSKKSKPNFKRTGQTKRRATGKTKSGNRKVEKKLDGNDELIGDSERELPTRAMAGDSGEVLQGD